MKRKYVFLTNTHDPFHADFEKYFCYSFHAMLCESSRKFELAQHIKYLRSHVIHRPSASWYYTVEELEKRNLVGVYAPLDTFVQDGINREIVEF